MSAYQWLLFFHVLGAFLLLSGVIAVQAFQNLAIRSDRPSRMALLFNLGRVAEAAMDLGAMLTLVLGIWLAEEAGYGVGDEWIVASIVLWAFSGLTTVGGRRRYKLARVEAEQLASGADVATPELRALARDRGAIILTTTGSLAAFAILVLMIWKPGAL